MFIFQEYADAAQPSRPQKVNNALITPNLDNILDKAKLAAFNSSFFADHSWLKFNPEGKKQDEIRKFVISVGLTGEYDSAQAGIFDNAKFRIAINEFAEKYIKGYVSKGKTQKKVVQDIIDNGLWNKFQKEVIETYVRQNASKSTQTYGKISPAESVAQKGESIRSDVYSQQNTVSGYQTSEELGKQPSESSENASQRLELGEPLAEGEIPEFATPKKKKSKAA